MLRSWSKPARKTGLRTPPDAFEEERPGCAHLDTRSHQRWEHEFPPASGAMEAVGKLVGDVVPQLIHLEVNAPGLTGKRLHRKERGHEV